MPTRLMQKHFQSVTRKFRNWGLYLIAALLFLIIGFYNDFPILDSDTGTYLASGYTLQPPRDRPIFYGLFLRLFSHGHSVWMPVFAQSVLLAILVIAFIREFIIAITPSRILAFILMLSLCTTAGWYASQLLPDVFTPILFLSLFCLLFGKNNSSIGSLAYWLIALWAVLAHSSHLLITILFSGVLFFYVLLCRQKQYFPKIAALGVLCISGGMISATSNYLGGYGFTLSPSSHVFLASRMVENGLFKYYLDRNCATNKYKLCQYKDSLPTLSWEYMWNSNSPMQKVGGWEGSKAEHEMILKDMFSKTQYFFLWMYKSTIGTLRQLATTDIDETNELEWVKFEPGSSPYDNIKKFIPFELNEVTASKQYSHSINIIYLDRIYLFTLVVSSLGVLLFWKEGPHDQFKKVYVCLLLFLVFNAFITATFSSIATRLNSRAIWLLSFINMIFLYNCFESWYQHRKTGKILADTDVAL